MKPPTKLRKKTKSETALFLASRILDNSDLVHEIAAENRLFYLVEKIRLIVWNKAIEELAKEYVIGKKIPRPRRINKVFKDHMTALFRGDYDEDKLC